ncbi:MAG TPA: glycosyltransferase [Terriglobales bacterium]|nr:glycosyltransferase [Terriglobales bacterium]
MTTSHQRKIRVAYVIKEMIVGGSQTHLMQVLRLLDRSRFEPVMYCLSGRGPLLEDVRALGVEVISPAASRGFHGVDLAVRVRALASSLRERQIDVVHAYLLRANLVGSLAARAARVPIVLCSKRGCHERRGFELLSAKIGNYLADRVTANAEAVRQFVHGNEGCRLDKMTVIPSGINTTRFQPLPPADYKGALGLPPGRLVVGIVTRGRVRKGVEEFIRAIGLVRARRADVHGLIVGEVPVEDSLTALIDEAGVRDHLTLLGARKDMPEVLSAFDLFVLSSHDEGMSNAILEAMAMERPVVATDVGGTGEVVRHGESGLLVPPRNPIALAKAILEVAEDPQRARAMGALGREIVESKFSANAMVRQMQDLYLDIAAQRGLAWQPQLAS